MAALSEHIEHNWAFAKEIRSSAAFQVLLSDTLHGANPLRTPGVLATSAIPALAAT